tara:strand:- start:3271 stop:3792 length:522 start_codon:yes stop_codon:yes gene_type:complete
MAGKLLQVASTTVTTAVSAIDFSTKITDNNVYQLVFTNLAPTSDSQNLEFRVTKTSDNSPDSTSNYDRAGKRLRGNTTFSDVTVQNDDSFIQDTLGNGTGESYSGIYNLYNFFDSNLYSMATFRPTGYNSSPYLVANTGAFWHTVAQSNNGIYIFFASGTIASGTVALYKVLA